MKKCLLMILIAFVGFLGIGMVRGLLEKTEINESTIRERPVISYIQNASGYAGDIAATKDAVFVAYNEKMAAIEAYNYSGVYQYTILLADAQNIRHDRLTKKVFLELIQRNFSVDCG